jgi:hypothetical protein
MKKFLYIILFLLFCANLFVYSPSWAKKHRTPVYQVHGQIFDEDNRPAAGALVILHPLDGGKSDSFKPVARVDDKGNFALTTYKKNDGGPEGEYSLTVQWRKPPSTPFGGEGEDRLQGKYSNPKTSKLKIKINNQPDNAIPPIHLQ